MNLIILGPPGAGKGTYAELVEKEFRIPHIAAGELLRIEVNKGTGLGKKVNKFMSKGNLVPAKFVYQVLEKRLEKKDTAKGFILDGAPRKLDQAIAIDRMLDWLGKKTSRVLWITTREKEIIRRLGNRWQCPECDMVYGIDNKPKVKGYCDECGSKLYQRKDDKPEVIRKRIQVYKRQTEPLIKYYRQKKLLKRINGNRPIKPVYADIKKALQGILRATKPR